MPTPAVGHMGAGVYFWEYSSEEISPYAVDLAKAWWHRQKERNCYKSASDASCAVVKAEVNVEDSKDFFNTETSAFRDLLLKTFTVRKVEYNEKNIRRATVKFIDEFEKMSSTTIGVIRAQLIVPRPSTGEYYSSSISRQARAFIVRNHYIQKIHNIEIVELK